jgi:hypothetical protein
MAFDGVHLASMPPTVALAGSTDRRDRALARHYHTLAESRLRRMAVILKIIWRAAPSK